MSELAPAHTFAISELVRVLQLLPLAVRLASLTSLARAGEKTGGPVGLALKAAALEEHARIVGPNGD